MQGVPSARAHGLGWLGSWVLHCLANSAWTDGNLAEAAGQLGKMAGLPNQSQPNPARYTSRWDTLYLFDELTCRGPTCRGRSWTPRPGSRATRRSPSPAFLRSSAAGVFVNHILQWNTLRNLILNPYMDKKSPKWSQFSYQVVFSWLN